MVGPSRPSRICTLRFAAATFQPAQESPINSTIRSCTRKASARVAGLSFAGGSAMRWPVRQASASARASVSSVCFIAFLGCRFAAHLRWSRRTPGLLLSAKAQLPRKFLGGLVHEPGLFMQRLQRQPPHRPGDADRAGHAAEEIVDRHGDAANFGVELTVVKGDTVAAYFLEFSEQCIALDDRLRRESGEFALVEIALELGWRQRRQQHLAKGGGVGGAHGARAVDQL